jgi:microcompartment protein CcmL/EutN
VQTAAAIIIAASVIGGFVLWLIVPRVQSWVQTVAAANENVRKELDPREDDSTAANARTAAEAAAELPRLRELIESVLRWQAEREQQRIPERIQLMELTQENHERRLGTVEQAVIGQLAERNAQHHYRKDQP